VSKPRVVTVMTHRSTEDTRDALALLIERATAEGVELRFSEEEAEKHGLTERPGVTLGADLAEDGTDLVAVLGGDGTILRAMRTFVGRGVPVFAFNFGAIGFLSTVDHGQEEEGIRRVLEGDFELLSMPALSIDAAGGVQYALNDISFHRRPNMRVAELSYSVEGDQLGKVRCDGLVTSTPAGSTGYNLANGGPVLAWGVKGYTVSFIAPHTLTARALVVATGDTLSVMNCSEGEPVDVMTDGQVICPLQPQEELHVRFEENKALLAQLPGATFYHRLREKFGRLAY
jgi:NAD+ kinase